MHSASESELVDPVPLLGLREFRVPGEPDPAQDVAQTFIDVTPDRLARLRSAAEAGCLDDVRAIAHQIRGSCGSVGATAMHGAASDVESCASTAELVPLVHHLEVLFDRTTPILLSLLR